MELSRERSPPAAAQELPGGERYLERGFPLCVFFSFSVLGGESVSFSFALFFACCLCFFCSFVIAFVVIVSLVVIEFAVGVLCSGKKTIDQLFL